MIVSPKQGQAFPSRHAIAACRSLIARCVSTESSTATPVKPPFARQGLFRLQAQACGPEGSTKLTQIVHRHPARILPLDNHSARTVGAVWCALSSYGGGLLGGDRIEADVIVDTGAALCLTTQASTKIYKAKRDGFAAEQIMKAVVKDEGLLVIAPDPLVPFADSIYEQRYSFDISRGASVVIVDWLGAGRASNGERWAFRSYSSSAKYVCECSGPNSDNSPPTLIDALTLRPLDTDGKHHGFDLGGVKRNTTASVVAIGPRAGEVAARLRKVSAALLAKRARVGGAQLDGSYDLDIELSGHIEMGVSDVPYFEKASGAADAIGTATVARIVAPCTEDMYRLLRECLQPLSKHLGDVPYNHLNNGSGRQDSSLHDLVPGDTQQERSLPSLPGPVPLTAMQRLAMMQLTDATLPTGGFAHSGGAEALQQLGLLSDEVALRDLLSTAALSQASLHAPFAVAAYELAKASDEENCSEKLIRILAQLNALLVSNGVGCRASSQQGQALARIAVSWLNTSNAESTKHSDSCRTRSSKLLKVARSSLHCHAAPVFGLVGAGLDLPKEAMLEAFAYVSSRDMLSALVRLNSVGPLRAVSLQAEIASQLARAPVGSLENAAPTSPILDASHASHSMLEMRLFQT